LRQFQNLKITLLLLIYSPNLHSISDELSWYIHDASYIISTKIAKKQQIIGTDRGEVLVFQQFMYSWVCYECVKLLAVFGIQPTIRDDIAGWSSELNDLFKYFTNKNSNENLQTSAETTLEILMSKTDHCGIFGKHSFGTKLYLKKSSNPVLPLVILTWMRQLQQYFFIQSENNEDRDWNSRGRYCATKSKNTEGEFGNLNNINMSVANENNPTPVTDISEFKPDDKKGVTTSLEEWAGRILNPHVDLKLVDKESADRLNRASQKLTFKLNDTNHSARSPRDNNKEATSSTKNLFNISPDRQKDKSTTELLLAISTTIQQIASSAEKKVSSSKRLSKPAKNDLHKQGDAVSSFIALTNRLEETKCESLTDTLQQLETIAKSAVTSQEESKDTDIDEGASDSDSSTTDEPEEN
jgi:hypothetical protein